MGLGASMSIMLSVPKVDELSSAAEALKRWQLDEGALQLHSGDLGWHSQNGAEATAAAMRMWSCAGKVLAIGLLDGPGLVRLAVAPDRCEDAALAHRLAVDLDDPAGGVLAGDGDGGATVEARGAELLTQLLLKRGWDRDEPWTTFHRARSRRGVGRRPLVRVPWRSLHRCRPTPYGRALAHDGWWTVLR